MKTFLHKLRLFFIVFFLFQISGKVNAQCVITTVGTVNSSTLVCGTSPLNVCNNGTLTIGDGSSITKIYMDAELDLRCLGAIQVIVKNKGSFDFSPGNNRLYLAEGSFITFEEGSDLIGGSCNASERIYIGTNLLASCNGGAGADLSFPELLSFGGTGSATSNSPVCVGNNIVLSATSPPIGTFTYKWVGPNSFTSTLQNPTPFAATITPNTAGIYIVTMTRLDGKKIDAYTTVVVNTGTLPDVPTVDLEQPTCTVATGTITVLTPIPDNVLKYSINGLTYTNISGIFTFVSSGTYSVTAKNASGCISPALSVTINAQPVTPIAPTGTAAQSFCSGTSPTVASLSATGSGIQWYNAASGGSPLSTTDALTTGNHYYASQTVGDCESTARFDVTVAINANPAEPTGTVSQSFCSGATVASLGATGSGIQWYAASSGGSSLATSTALSDGNHYYASQTVSGCESVARFGVAVTINVAPAAPVVPSALSIGCSATAFVANWAASVNTTNYYLDVATDPLFSSVLPSYSNLSLGNVLLKNVTGLAIGSAFYVRLRAENGCGTGPNSATMVVSVPTTTYNLGAWDNLPPDSTKRAVFAGNATVTTQLDACSCQINSGVNVVVGVSGGLNDTAILKLENGLNVLGTLTFENNASLVQVNDANNINTGSIIYKRITTPMKNFDYTYWSSPVAGQTLQALSPNTLSDKYFSYSLNTWVTHLNGARLMDPPGTGFIIRVPKPDITYPNGEYWTGTTYAQSVQFVGVPNNGAYSLGIDPTGYSNLIGNPYPCAMSADAFLLENSINNPRIEGTIRLWTHNTVITNNKYSATDFASYNYVGGVGTAAPSASTGGINTSIPSGYIAAGQSFMTKSTGGGSVVFNNSMRVSLANKNAQFFKGTKSKVVAIEKHRVWLDLTNTEGAFKQMLVGYVTGGTNEFDSAFDGLSLNSNKYIDFYSINDNKNYVIQGRALPFDKTDKVPLGYKTTIEGIFAISIDQADGILANESIFVEDKVKGVIVDLRKGSYSFSTAIGTFNDRFVLRFTDNDGIAKIFNTANLDKPVIISVQNHQIKIDSFGEIIDKLMVYDLNGRLLYEKENVNSNIFSIPNFNSSEQFLIVQTLLKNGEWVTKEIVF